MPGDRESLVAVAAWGRWWSTASREVNQWWHSLAHQWRWMKPRGRKYQSPGEILPAFKNYSWVLWQLTQTVDHFSLASINGVMRAPLPCVSSTHPCLCDSLEDWFILSQEETMMVEWAVMMFSDLPFHKEGMARKLCHLWVCSSNRAPGSWVRAKESTRQLPILEQSLPMFPNIFRIGLGYLWLVLCTDHLFVGKKSSEI